MTAKKSHYVVSPVITEDGKKVWYCHNIITPNIPVLGSVGTKTHALAVAKVYNRSIGYSD